MAFRSYSIGAVIETNELRLNKDGTCRVRAVTPVIEDASGAAVTLNHRLSMVDAAGSTPSSSIVDGTGRCFFNLDTAYVAASLNTGNAWPADGAWARSLFIEFDQTGTW